MFLPNKLEISFEIHNKKFTSNDLHNLKNPTTLRKLKNDTHTLTIHSDLE